MFKEPIRKNLSEMASYHRSHSILVVLVTFIIVILGIFLVIFLIVILGIFLVIFVFLVE